MSPSLHCSSCCSSCFRDIPPHSESNSPYTQTGNLLALGIVSISIPVVVEHRICDHIHADDDWHHFQASAVLPNISDPDEIALCRGVEFLMKEHFIVATRRSNDFIKKMDIRIYLVPYDLPNVQGKLRLRKESVLGPARRYMRALLPQISQDVQRWNGFKPAGGDLPISADPRSLSDIYSDLASPQPVPTPDCGHFASRLLNFQDDLNGFKMRSTLYRYQRRSIAAMIQKEMDLQDVPDPLYIPIKTIHDEVFYIQPGTTEVLREVPMSATCRGGILCEELGTGKTVMMLGLILATRKQVSTPEPSLVDDRPVMTPVAYRGFSASEFSSARKRAGITNPGKRRVPSLVELMVHRSRTAPFDDIPTSTLNRRHSRNATVEDEINTLSLGEMLRANVPFYHHYLGEPQNRERTHRSKQPKAPKVMYLTSATLIVVPANLLSQWDREIQKHCAHPLRVFILRTKTPMPTVQMLANDYDIILMSYTRFSTESTKNNTQKLHVHQPCECPLIPNSNIPKCSCQVHSVSPFLQIRWKRLIIDEGHVSSSLSTNLVPFAKMLSVERRWIVTGTPTTNLLGLSLGSKTAVEPDECAMDVMDLCFPSNYSADSQRVQSLPFASPPLPTPLPITKHRTWTKYDREDLVKLGNMITHFIAVPQFSADPKLVSTHVIEPLLDPQGPRSGAIQVLNQVMKMTMVRHRIGDVEQDVVLPPLKQESILLDLDPYVVLSFNALQASIVINAIDSERKDKDYMFHPTNADLLQDTVKNMSQILFWHANDYLYNAVELVKIEDETIRRATERKMPQQDIDAAREAFKHLRKAIQDPVWKYIQTHEDVPFRVYNLDEAVYDAWSRIPRDELHSQADPRLTGFLHADMLVRLDELIVKRPLIQQDDMKQIGTLMLQRDKVARQAYYDAQHKKTRRKLKSVGDESIGSLLVEKFTKKASSIDTLAEIQKELNLTLARLEQEDGDENEAHSTPGPSAVDISLGKRHSNFVASSPHAKIRIGSSASSKLNYIINEVEKYSKDEKFLIFSESPLTLAHVAEALELKHIKCLCFTTQVTPQMREQLVLTFETSEMYRVFLMELKHGARGLNLVSASRVIFCEPVWQADVESQAIKRAHRIGQVRPISVKTLAIRQTAEENMVARRSALKDSQEKLPKVLEEAGMRHYIANPKFITHTPDATFINEFPLVDLPPGLLQPRAGALTLKIPPLKKSPKRVRVEGAMSTGSSSKDALEGEPPLKKTKELSVRFAVP